MKSLLVGTGRYLCKVYNCHDSRAYGCKWSRILSRLVGMGWDWNGFGDEDNNTSATIIPSVEILGIITRS
jgi:hypothetical protein